MTETDINISGISDNLSDAIAQQIVKEETKIIDTLLRDKQIAISVSESEEISSLGLSDYHITDVSVELARYLFANGAKLLYGGDLRQGGFTEIFSDLSYQYKFLNDKTFRFINYFPFPTSRLLSLPVRADFIKKQVEIKKLNIPKHLSEVDQEKKYLPTNDDDRYIIAECLTDMRQKMANESDARIIVGGRQTGFIGYYPGIVEEAYYTLKEKKPLYVIGGYGGAAGSISKLLRGEKVTELTNEFQFREPTIKKFKIYADSKGQEKLDYMAISKFFDGFSVESLSELNGLTVEENHILFESINIHEIIFILFKGFKKAFG